MASLALGVRFNPVSNGTADFVYSSVVTGYRDPVAGLTNSKTYRYRAESADLSEWEFGTGIWSSTTNTLSRNTVSFSSTGSKVSFTNPPQVAITIAPDDMLSFDDTMSLTTTQQAQARSNIGAASSPSSRTRTVKTSGSGTYTTPTGCKSIFVRLVGGGAGGTGVGSGATFGNPGVDTTFGTLTAGGGHVGSGFLGGTGGTASGGDINLSGGTGEPASTIASTGGTGGHSIFGGAGPGGIGGGSGGVAAATNSGSGGGGAASTTNSSQGGGAGAYCEKLIVSPASSYSYAVGAGGAGGIGGVNNAGAGAAGIIIIDEYY